MFIQYLVKNCFCWAHHDKESGRVALKQFPLSLSPFWKTGGKFKRTLRIETSGLPPYL